MLKHKQIYMIFLLDPKAMMILDFLIVFCNLPFQLSTHLKQVKYSYILNLKKKPNKKIENVVLNAGSFELKKNNFIKLNLSFFHWNFTSLWF